MIPVSAILIVNGQSQDQVLLGTLSLSTTPTSTPKALLVPVDVGFATSRHRQPTQRAPRTEKLLKKIDRVVVFSPHWIDVTITN